MLNDYLKVFFRLLARNRTFSSINLLGLTAGIACFVLIRIYVTDERSYDRQIPLSDRTYRLALKGEMSGFSFESAVMGGPIGRVIHEEVPGVISSTTFYKLPVQALLNTGEHKFYEDKIIFADTQFTVFFGIKTIQGNPLTMLEAPWSIVLTRSGVKKYFGKEDPLGKVITWNNRQAYTVTGIIEDPSQNSHLNFDILASSGSLMEQASYRDLLKSFYAFITYNYIKLDESNDAAGVKDKIAGVIEKYMGDGMRESGSRFEIYLQPVTGIHLHSNLVHELEPNGSSSSVLIFSAISMLILLVAMVNFVNLTTARSADRSLETGIRRACGASRNILIQQFLLESICFALCGTFIAGILVEILIYPFCNFSGIHYTVPGFNRLSRWITLIVIGTFAGIT
jgi:putative ABC transport system permease protein